MLDRILGRVSWCKCTKLTPFDSDTALHQVIILQLRIDWRDVVKSQHVSKVKESYIRLIKSEFFSTPEIAQVLTRQTS